MPIDTDAWDLHPTYTEVKAASILEENSVIYALKNEHRVTVIQRNMQNASEAKLMEYDELDRADKSGNLWRGLPPSVSLSPDKKILAYVDTEGLKVYNLESKNTSTYIRKVDQGKCDDCAPKWAVSPMERTYALSQLHWSNDGKFISFLKAHYEGSGYGMIDTQSGEYIPLEEVGGSYNRSIA